MKEDYTEVIRKADELQKLLDEVFRRGNTNAVYRSEAAIREAISDNPRFYNEDRKNDLAEILYALIDLVYGNILAQNRETPCCNPQLPPESGDRLPDAEMLMRIMMPLGWALDATWFDPTQSSVIDDYIGAFSEREVNAVYQCLDFLFQLFPEYLAMPTGRDVLEYWRKLATERDSMRVPDEHDRQLLRSFLECKKAEFQKRESGK